MEMNEAYADSQATNAAAIKNARGVVSKNKLVGLLIEGVSKKRDLKALAARLATKKKE